MKLLGVTGQIRPVREFFFNLTQKTIEERERNNVIRKDLMQYLIKIRNDNIKSDSNDDEWKISSNGEFALETIVNFVG
jgi:cytochrome P450 family 6